MAAKRRRSFDGRLAAGCTPQQPHRLSHEDYTVGWICALPVELAASRAMLDSIHQPVATHFSDTNTYVFGNIGPHNIVMTCLGAYGIGTASHVATHMSRTFPCLRIQLMVGIGGGAPRDGNDVRLGDVVVGRRVVQYDLGKINHGGHFTPNHIVSSIPQELSAAITSVKVLHESEPSAIPQLIDEMLENYPRLAKYSYPSIPDRLFVSEYKHDSSTSCDECNVDMLKRRHPRSDRHPRIHYGAIASGNSVMKDSLTRDRLAQELDVICFDMEAAGFIGHFACLSIRGICDYADSHKNKDWQPYAAATAAAFAKELLSSIHKHNILPTEPGLKVDLDLNMRQEHQDKMMVLLAFDTMQSRKSNIRSALSTTCEWFLGNEYYQAWVNSQRLDHRFLWISGKPGSGKSTLMKFLLSREPAKTSSDAAVVFFFFNARGQLLERSVLGMYRSLLHQLLAAFPDLQTILHDHDLMPINSTECPSLEGLRDLLRNALLLLGERSVVGYIDALDECDEDEVRDMIDHFEELCQHEESPHFRICFSTRPYPHIQLEHGLRLVLQDQLGHREDLKKYIQSHLRTDSSPQSEGVRRQILNKARGTFMWVVLVVRILNKEYSRGTISAVQKRLEEIPRELSGLFREICGRDDDHPLELRLCLQWILFSERPLSPKEVYYAVCSGLSDTDGMAYTITQENASKFVISMSKGLAEPITVAGKPTVELIHESVRDFLLQNHGFHELWPELGLNIYYQSHNTLQECCHAYISYVTSMAPHGPWDPQRLRALFPFLEYAASQIFLHAEIASTMLCQKQFLQTFDLESWTTLSDPSSCQIFDPIQGNFYAVLARRGYSKLIRMWQEVDPSRDADLSQQKCAQFMCALFEALSLGNRDAARAILGLQDYVVMNQKDHLRQLQQTSSSWKDKGILMSLAQETEQLNEAFYAHWRSELYCAAEKGDGDAIESLIDADVSHINSGKVSFQRKRKRNQAMSILSLLDSAVPTGGDYARSLLSYAVVRGMDDMTMLLIESGADINYTDKVDACSLCYAIHKGHLRTIKLLLHLGVEVEHQALDPGRHLRRAFKKGRYDIAVLLLANGASWHIDGQDIQELMAFFGSRAERLERLAFLIDNGANIEVDGESGRTLLMWAAQSGNEACLELLIEHGADVNVRDSTGWDPLIWAAKNGHYGCMVLLTENGADVNHRDQYGRGALSWAAVWPREDGVRLLIERGADVNCRDEKGAGPLALACSHQTSLTLVQLFLDAGANINDESDMANDRMRMTPLMQAVLNGNRDILELLIENGANINIRDEDGCDPLMTAISSCGRQPSHPNNYHTPVFECVELLLKKGANPHAKDRHGRDAATWANRTYGKKFVELLVAHGVDESRFISSLAYENQTEIADSDVEMASHTSSRSSVEPGSSMDDV